MLVGLLWALACLLLLLVVLLAIPVEVKFDLRRWEGERKSSIALVWLFGAVRLPLGSKARSKPKQPKKVEKAKDGRSRVGRLLSMLQTEGFPGRVLQLARDLFRRIRIRDLSLDTRLGLDDPADTGRLWGIVGPLFVMLPASRVMQVSVQPDFAAEVFEYQGRGHISIVPIQVLALLIAFALSPVTLRALRAEKGG